MKKRSNKIKLAGSLVAIMVLSLSLYSCGGETAGNSNGNSDFTMDDAIKVAEAYAPENTVMTETKDDDDGVYEISFANNDHSRVYEFDVNKTSHGVNQIELSTADDNGSIETNISIKQAEKIIRDKFDNLTNVNVNLEQDDSYFIYEVNFTTDKFHGEAEINPSNGKVMDMSISYLDQNVYNKEDFNFEKAFVKDAKVHIDKKPAPVNGNKTGKEITLEKAKKLVLNKLPGGTVTEIEEDMEGGISVYEGEAIKDNYEYDFEINKDTGEFIKWHQEMRD